MTDPVFTSTRRTVIAGLSAVTLAPLLPHRLVAAEPSLRAEAGSIGLAEGKAAASVWQLAAPTPVLRARRGSPLKLSLTNALPAPTVLSWHAPAGSAGTETLLSRLQPNATATLVLPTTRAGTGFADIRLLSDGAAAPTRPLPLVIDESEPPTVDRDEVLLIEDWRLKADGTALAPGVASGDAQPLHTINGRSSLDLSARVNERLRLRIISGCQRAVVAIKFEGIEVRVMAIDGQPAEPFAARGGALVLTPGGRVDAFVDLAVPAGTSSQILLHDGKEARPIGKITVSGAPPVRPAPLPPAPPLPSNGLPERIDLKGATRIDLPLGGPPADWVAPASFNGSAPPAFRLKTGRTAVLALTNRGAGTTVFRLNGHHFRLLDKLDDGWKPFWLDTLAIEPGQTQRVAFVAEHAGRWLVEQVGTDWAAPRLVRWYGVE